MLSIMLWLEGADADWSDDFFRLLPGEAREVQVRSWSPMPAAEVAARLCWRAL
jgi:Ig-fold domain